MGGKISNTEFTRYPRSLPQPVHITREGRFGLRITHRRSGFRQPQCGWFAFGTRSYYFIVWL